MSVLSPEERAENEREEKRKSEKITVVKNGEWKESSDRDKQSKSHWVNSDDDYCSRRTW